MHPFRPKDQILIYAAVAMLGLIALAATLRDFQFAAPQPIGREYRAPVEYQFEQVIQGIKDIPVWKSILVWVLFLTIIALVSALLSRELRRRLFRTIIRTASFVFIFLYVIEHRPDLVTILNPLGASGAGDFLSGTAADIPVPVFRPPQISPALVFLASFLLLSLVFAGLWFLNRWWRISKIASPTSRPLKELASIARASLSEIESGSDWGDAILRCYERMNRIVEKKRGLHRERSMTPAEFAIRLERAGLPHDPLDRLTRLFEYERYSARPAGNVEISEAVACLREISRACGEEI